jgi:hypothetical protein
VPKEESFTYQGTVRRGEVEPTSTTSPGNAGGSDPGIARAEYTAAPRRTPSHRFVELIELLERLSLAGSIGAWRVVHPPTVGIEFENGAVGWPFLNRPDPRRPWCYIDRESGRIRSLLICEIRMVGASVHWLEVETRTTEAFRAVLFQADGDVRDDVIMALMSIAEEHKGRWPPSTAASAAKAGAVAVKVWKHHYEGEDGKQRPLRAQPALAALRSVASG